MKRINVVLIVLLILIADQALKIWVKTHFTLGGENGSLDLIGKKAQLYFIENMGMAYGWSFGGNWGKLALTVFRMFAVFFGTFLIAKFIKQGYTKGFIICAALIYAGALGNLIDSMFYGMIFDKGMFMDPATHQLMNYDGIAKFSSNGYSSFLHGNVVDMLYFPVIEGDFPDWVPFVGKDKSFIFFRPIFNIADAAISTGVITILVFQKRFFKHKEPAEITNTIETGALVNDESQVQ